MLLHAAARSVVWLLALLFISIGSAALAPHFIASSPLRDADQAWRDGRALEAWQLYTQLAQNQGLPPHAQLRLAGLALERGACGDAELLAAQALTHAIARDDAALAHLIRAQCAVKREAWNTATAAWIALDAQSPLRAVAHVLQGEHALGSGDTYPAVKHFERALRHALPAPWTAFAQLRLAQMSVDRTAAQQHLQFIPTTLPTPDPSTRPLLPLPPSTIVAQAAHLRAVVAAPSAEHDQLRGQHLLNAALWQLAIAHFDHLAQFHPDDPRPRAYGAYARYQMGERRAATDALRVLHRRFPSDPLVATLRATLALHAGEPATAAAIVDRAAKKQPLDPALALVRSDVLVAQRRYADALAERRRARDIAPAAQRGRYALALAQHHLDLAYNLCGYGVTAAQEVTALAPTNRQAWQIMAAVHYHCGRYTDAIAAAQQGLVHAPDEPALHFFLGSALWEAKQHDDARHHLIRAADLAPNSLWRERAEDILKIEN